MADKPINPMIEPQVAFISRIKGELELFIREDLKEEGINLTDVNGFETVFAIWFFTNHTEWTIDRLDDRLKYLHRQLSRWSCDEAIKNSDLPETLVEFHVRRFKDHFQIFDVSNVVWPIDFAF